MVVVGGGGGASSVAEDPPILQEGATPVGLTPIPAGQQPPIPADYSPPLEKVTETIFASTEILKIVGFVATDHLPA